MAEQSIYCPACGAPIDPSLRFEDQITCPYCGTQSYIGESTKALSQDSSEDEHATLTMVYTRFEVGKTGTVKLNGQTKEFSIYGRLQYEYEGGYWSEWYLGINDEGYWLQEDEGVYILYLEKNLNIENPHIQALIQELQSLVPAASPQPNPSQYADPIQYQQALYTWQQEYMKAQSSFDFNVKLPKSPGFLIQVDDKISFHLMEHGRAKMVAYEGTLPTPPQEGREIYYLDGAKDGNVYSLELEDGGKDASFYVGWPLEYEDIWVEGEKDPKDTVGSKGV